MKTILGLGSKSGRLALAAFMAAALAAGCAKKEGDPAGAVGANDRKPPEISTEPVTLTVFNSSMGDPLFQNAIVIPLRNKYPHITIEMIKKGKGSMMEDLIAAGSVPDIIFGDNSGDIPVYRELDVLSDLMPYIKKYGFELNKFDPVVLSSVQANFPSGQIWMLPSSVNIATLHYNRDIFDKFGVPYPKDGMTWDETVDLARRVTRMDGGVQYAGFDFANNVLLPYNQLSAPMVNAQTMKAAVNTDQWKKIFDTMKRFYEIPGNDWGKGGDAFLKSKTLAMYAGTSMFGSLPDATKNGLNWDVVALPSFPDAPKTTIQLFAPLLGVSKTSKHQDQAFLAVAHLLSEEGQRDNVRQGRPSALNNADIKQQFGKDVEVLQGRNAGAFTYSKLAATPQAVTKYDSTAFPIIRDKFREAAVGGKDVNTALKEAEEAINKEIEKRKNQ
ncbi:MAG: family 1 extracellular solute-binding protein [Paenibacillus sp.]|jgi:multiple sugar transport system substrate-binding protein|nr:family 1 extracellular solute-binding protein [Paenibacillus sp.]